MIYLELFLTFLKIGAFSFGGGYGMISVMRESCLANGWLDEAGIMNFIAVAESTPGPIAVNMATFVGSSQAGFFGALVATLGVVLPSFIIILIIASVIKNLLKLAGVKAALGGIKPVIIGLITATGITLFLSVVFNVSTVKSDFEFDYRSFIILAFITLFAFLVKKIRKKQFSPILLILISAGMGIILF
jgi:chromate transporter